MKYGTGMVPGQRTDRFKESMCSRVTTISIRRWIVMGHRVRCVNAAVCMV